MRKLEGYQKGVNLGGWLSQPIRSDKDYFDTFIQESDIETIAGWGLDHVRVPVDYMTLEQEDGTFKEEGFAYLDRCAGWCKKHHLNMIIDLHKTFGYSFDPLDDGDLEIFFHREEYQERFYRLWREIARRFGSYGEMAAFELLNEIVSPNVAEAWNQIVSKAVKEIRAVAKDNYIIFGGVHFNHVSSVALLSKPEDEKIVYNFHCYEPMVFTHQKAYWVPGMPKDLEMAYPAPMEEYKEKSKVLPPDLAELIINNPAKMMGKTFFDEMFRSAAEAAEKVNVPLYCGEYGVIDKAPLDDTLRWYQDIHAVFEKYGIGRAAWNYKGKDYGMVDEHYAPIRERLLKCL